MQTLTNFPELVRIYRKSMGLSQQELAKRWNYSFETISAWERGKRSPNNKEVPRLARFMDMDAEELVQCININRNKVDGEEELAREEVKREWTKAFEMWGEVRGIYRNRIDFNRDFSYPRMFENAQTIFAVGISLNAVTLNYSHEAIVESITQKKRVYQLCFLNPTGKYCAVREQEENYPEGFLADLTRLNMHHMEVVRNRLKIIDPQHVEQLQVKTYDMLPRFNIYIVDNSLMTVQCYAYGRGEETPLFVLVHQGNGGLFDYYASVAKYYWDAQNVSI